MNFSLVLTNWNFTLVCFLQHLKAMKSDLKTKNLGSNLDGQIAIKLDQHHSPEKFFHVYSEGRMGVTRKVLFFNHSKTTSRGGERHSTHASNLGSNPGPGPSNFFRDFSSHYCLVRGQYWEIVPIKCISKVFCKCSWRTKAWAKLYGKVLWNLCLVNSWLW